MATNTTTKQVALPAGKIYFKPAAEMGERYLGLSTDLTVDIATEEANIYSMESSIRSKYDTTLTGIDITGGMTLGHLSFENLALWLAGTYSTTAATGASYTDEALTVIADRYYQLGTSTTLPAGRRNVSAVTITDDAGEGAVAWVADTVTALGAFVKPTTSPVYYYECTSRSGDFKTHATTEPTWPTTIGATVVDDVITWTCRSILVPVLDTDYTVDATLGRIRVLYGARIVAAGTTWNVDYTTTTSTWENVARSGLVSVTGALRFVAENMKGNNRDLFAPNVTLKPTGSAVFKAETPDYVKIAFELSFAEGANAEPPVQIDGRPL